jgi:CBS domain containing-hemolysin-like protein
MEIDELNEHLQFNLPEGPYETLGGFLLSQLHHIPTVGETVEYRGWHFKVSEANARTITRVLVSKQAKTRNA